MWFDIVEFWFGIGNGQILSIFDIFMYCLAVQAGFYSDAVECRTESSEPGLIPGRGKLLFPFFQLLHLAPNVNNLHVCIKLLESHFT